MVWDLEAGGQLADVTCGEYLNAVCWSPDQAWNQWKAAQNFKENIKYAEKKRSFCHLSMVLWSGCDICWWKTRRSC
jgi:hypothetical protein